MSCDIIKASLTEIENQLGLKLKLYDGNLKEFNKETFFDVELNDSCWCSKEYTKLILYSDNFKTFRVEQTGYKRVGIFLKQSNGTTLKTQPLRQPGRL